MENKDQKDLQQEIDLLYVLKQCFKGVELFLKAIVRFLLRKWLWLLGFLIVGIVIGVIVSRSSEKYYETHLLMQSKNVRSDVIIQQIDALNGFIVRGDTASLQKALKISSKEVLRLKKIAGLYAIDANRDKYPDYADINENVKKNPADTNMRKMSDFFYLYVEVFSDEVPTFVVDALKKYINEDVFCVRENEFALLQKKEMLEQMKYQLIMLDSLQKTELLSKREQREQIVFSEKDKSLYYKEYLDLYKKKLELEKELQLYTDIITEMQDFPLLSAAKNKTITYVKGFVIFTMSLGVFSLVLWDNRKKIAKWVK